MKTVYFKKLDSQAQIPEYMTPNSAGMDLSIIVKSDTQKIFIDQGEVTLLCTGLAIEMPHNMEAQIRPRSGLSLKYPNYLANSPGTIDSDYRGEIRIPFVNHTRNIAIVGHGDRIAQIIFSRVVHVKIINTNELNPTMRNAGGFGHTGI